MLTGVAGPVLGADALAAGTPAGDAPAPNGQEGPDPMPASPPSAAFRPARTMDAALLAQLIDLAGEGIPAWLWRKQAAPGESPLDVGTRRAAREEGGFSYRNAWVIEHEGRAVGMLLGYVQPDPFETGPLEELPRVVRPLVELEALAPGSWYVNAVAVVPGQRGRGLGSALMQHAAALARSAGCGQLSLIVAGENAAAARLYRRLGYREVAARPIVPFEGFHYGGEWLLMVRPTNA